MGGGGEVKRGGGKLREEKGRELKSGARERVREQGGGAGRGREELFTCKPEKLTKKRMPRGSSGRRTTKRNRQTRSYG